MRGYKSHYHKIRKQLEFVLAYHSCKHISKVVSSPYNSHIQIVFKSTNLWQRQNIKEMYITKNTEEEIKKHVKAIYTFHCLHQTMQTFSCPCNIKSCSVCTQ
jgi:hypothetical protein